MDLSEQLQKERERQKKTIYRVATDANTDQSHIKKLESGKVSPTMGIMQRICAALNVSVKIMPDGSTIVKKEK